MEKIKTKTVWITKYALTTGILEKQVEILSDKMISVLGQKYNQYYHKPYWHETRDGAIAHAISLRKKKIESLKKSIAKLEKIDFNI